VPESSIHVERDERAGQPANAVVRSAAGRQARVGRVEYFARFAPEVDWRRPDVARALTSDTTLISSVGRIPTSCRAKWSVELRIPRPRRGGGQCAARTTVFRIAADCFARRRTATSWSNVKQPVSLRRLRRRRVPRGRAGAMSAACANDQGGQRGPKPPAAGLTMGTVRCPPGCAPCCWPMNRCRKPGTVSATAGYPGSGAKS
jgi:hypothetical protein